MGKNHIRRYHRRSIRLKDYDYAQDGAYFVTLCVQGQARVLGDVRDGRVRLSEEGREVTRCWTWLSERYAYVRLDEWIVMPDHLHGIVVLDGDAHNGNGNIGGGDPGGGDPRNAPTDPRNPATKRKPLGRLVGAFKTVSTKRVNDIRGTPGARLWQRDFYEHTVRNKHSLRHIRQYIADNPTRWR